MKLHTLTLTLPLIMIISTATAQTKNSLIGTWYAKTENQDKAHHKASIYSKKEISGSSTMLKIDPSFRYRFSDDTVGGIITIQEDSLCFLPNNSRDTVKAFHYYLDSSQLIYSRYRIPENYSKPHDIRNNNDGFMPVEVVAKYRDGEYAFYKIIYNQLANDKNHPADSTNLLEFAVVINANGKPDLNSLESKNDLSKSYSASVKTALTKLKTDFIPCIQNGRVVRSYYTFRFNY